MTIRLQTRPMLCLFSAALLGLAACDKLGLDRGEMAWARAAIERNGQLEVVAADAQASVFTVRVKSTGELRTIRADEVVGGLPGSASASGVVATESKPATAPVTVPPSPPAPPTDTVSNTGPAREGFAEPGEEATPLSARNASDRDYSVTTVHPFDAEPSGKGVLATGPGYSIRRASVSTNQAPAVATLTSSRSDAGSPANSLSVEHRYEPIICQGGRLLHIDNRNLEFEGDAVSAEDGCEIHITNSRISAKGVGVFARAANVHIKNSSIEGASGSVEATSGAQVYVQSSTFKGLSRRAGTAAMHDLGGNVWN